MPFRVVVLAPADTPGFIVELNFDDETVAEFETEAPTDKQLLLHGRRSGEPWSFALEEFQAAWKHFMGRSYEILAETNQKL